MRSRSDELPPSRLPRATGALFHLLALLVLAVPYVMRIRRQPVAWAVFALLGVLPSPRSASRGSAGMPSWRSRCRSPQQTCSPARRIPAVVYLAASGSALVLLSVLVVRYSWVP